MQQIKNKNRVVIIVVSVILFILIVGGLIVINRRNNLAGSIIRSITNTGNVVELPKTKIGYELLGGANSLCLKTPILINGKDLGYRVGTQLGVYKDGLIPQYGKDKEAEVTENLDGVIKVKFHPITNYTSQDGKGGNYWLYIGLVYPYYLRSGNYEFSGCGYNGLTDLPDFPIITHFKGEFKWISSESNPPSGSGFGNTLLGGHIAYNFIDGHREILAPSDFGIPAGYWPKSLSDAVFENSNWWHNLWWSDWYNPKKADQWQEFDINITDIDKYGVIKSKNLLNRIRGGRNLANANNTKIMGLFVGPEYAIVNAYGVVSGPSVFELRNLRIETK